MKNKILRYINMEILSEWASTWVHIWESCSWMRLYWLKAAVSEFSDLEPGWDGIQPLMVSLWMNAKRRFKHLVNFFMILRVASRAGCSCTRARCRRRGRSWRTGHSRTGLRFCTCWGSAKGGSWTDQHQCGPRFQWRGCWWGRWTWRDHSIHESWLSLWTRPREPLLWWGQFHLEYRGWGARKARCPWAMWESYSRKSRSWSRSCFRRWTTCGRWQRRSWRRRHCGWRCSRCHTGRRRRWQGEPQERRQFSFYFISIYPWPLPF